MPRSINRRAIRAGVGVLGAAALVVVNAGVAAAHVTVSPGEAEAGSYTVLTVSVPHGCEGSATTEVAIQIPEQTPTVTPTVNSNWNVNKVMVDLEEPIIDSHGNELTERVDQVVYTARTPLPDDLRDTFELSIRMPDTPGETLAFPTVQTCEQGEHAWVQLAAEGQDPSELDEPAPLVTVTEPSADDIQSAASGDDGASGTLAVAGLSAGLFAIVLAAGLGGTALARTRRRA